MTHQEKLQHFAELITEDQKAYCFRQGWNWELHAHNMTAKVKPGKKYTKVDVGGSGKYMVDADGNIFGIKAYGVIHRGHHYGTLDTIDNYFWGDYVGQRKA